ncbi:tRNA-dihydrouridine synthase 2 protein [Paragonimus heterotremus]|uniref:tRNA-dihydrouridine synthase 2 protein n=1 Tax=Paragonimus heterotremus TaxID=100268 RepID=A0A8J4SZS1_9TREM|nr:tRNA-dihydrouridine synthase 2 protein [Paragonimus heterotremus]
MVRISTHPLRLLALKYGADYVFSEELIDQRILRSTRVVNGTSFSEFHSSLVADELNTVDFLLPDGSVTFRTSAEERKRVVAQLGTADSKQGLDAAKMLENDVFAIDVNMGCPKEYSIKGGMGAALLTKPDKVKEVSNYANVSVDFEISCLRITDFNCFLNT